jgi:hypothetical protein
MAADHNISEWGSVSGANVTSEAQWKQIIREIEAALIPLGALGAPMISQWAQFTWPLTKVVTSVRYRYR